MTVVQKVMHRQQLDRGDAERFQVVDRDRMRQASVGAAQLFGNVRMLLREALDVHLVDDRLVQRNLQQFVALPVERGSMTMPFGLPQASSWSSKHRSSSGSPMR